MTALSVKYIRELLMSLIPRASKGTDGQYSEPLVNGIVVGGTDKHTANAHSLFEGIGVVNAHDVPVKREFQSAYKFLTIIGKHLAANIRSLYFRFHKSVCELSVLMNQRGLPYYCIVFLVYTRDVYFYLEVSIEPPSSSIITVQSSPNCLAKDSGASV